MGMAVSPSRAASSQVWGFTENRAGFCLVCTSVFVFAVPYESAGKQEVMEKEGLPVEHAGGGRGVESSTEQEVQKGHFSPLLNKSLLFVPTAVACCACASVTAM